MKYILATLFLFSSLMAAPQEEIEVIEQLIATTKKNLESQQLLLKVTQDYMKAKEAYIGDPDSSRLATALVKRAMRLHHLMVQEHLSHLFSSDFLVELSFFNQVGKNQIAQDG